MNPLFIWAGRQPDHARCSHNNVFQPDVYKTNTKVIIFTEISFFLLTPRFVFSLVSRPDPGYQILAIRSWQRCFVPNPNKIHVWGSALASYLAPICTDASVRTLLFRTMTSYTPISRRGVCATLFRTWFSFCFLCLLPFGRLDRILNMFQKKKRLLLRVNATPTLCPTMLTSSYRWHARWESFLATVVCSMFSVT